MSYLTTDEIAGYQNAARDAKGFAESELTEIKRLLESAQRHWDSLPAQVRDKLDNLHNFEGSLGYCLQFGNTAVQELLEL